MNELVAKIIPHLNTRIKRAKKTGKKEILVKEILNQSVALSSLSMYLRTMLPAEGPLGAMNVIYLQMEYARYLRLRAVLHRKYPIAAQDLDQLSGVVS
jgi:hypothetical protein